MNPTFLDHLYQEWCNKDGIVSAGMRLLRRRWRNIEDEDGGGCGE